MKNVSDVLIVSESETLRTLVKFALGRWWGVVIRGAESAAQAREALAARAPQLAVVDADLPGAEGVGRALGASSHVIAINASGPIAWAAQTTQPPFQPQKLQAAIERLPD
jgi:DNA-binding NtrC family response regulator